MWLREQGGQRAFFPNLSNTSFDLPPDIHALVAMGTPSTNTSGGFMASQPCSSGSVLSASTRSLYCPGRPVFSTKKASGFGGPTVNVKVVQATITRNLSSGKSPEFVKTEQMYIPVKESQANVQYITKIMQENWDNNYVLVTADGLRLQDSPGTQGSVK